MPCLTGARLTPDCPHYTPNLEFYQFPRGGANVTPGPLEIARQLTILEP